MLVTACLPCLHCLEVHKRRRKALCGRPWRPNLPPIPSLVFFASNLPTLLPSLQDAFLLALKQYLQQHSYNNTHASDLWNAANATLPFDVPAAMVQWTYQAGYPLVSLTLDDRRRVWLHQAPFSLQGVSACDPSRAWWIPIRCNQAGRGGGRRMQAVPCSSAACSVAAAACV